MGKTKFNERLERLLNSKIDDVDLARIQSVIGDKEFEYCYIDDAWIEDQFIGDGTEYVHQKFGTVKITVELSILDIIGNNVLIENKRTYEGKYSGETNIITLYYFGPTEEETLKKLLADAEE